MLVTLFSTKEKSEGEENADPLGGTSQARGKKEAVSNRQGGKSEKIEKSEVFLIKSV